MLSILLWLPLAFGLVALLVPAARAGIVALTGAAVTLILAAVLAIGFDAEGGLQYVETTPWIPDLGISYALGVDGISIFLVVLTALAWVPASAAGIAVRYLPISNASRRCSTSPTRAVPAAGSPCAGSARIGRNGSTTGTTGRVPRGGVGGTEPGARSEAPG